jgi:Putative Actinobacterial Holin-X, holin superfamily III
MPTRATDATRNGGLSAAAKDVADHASNLANLVKELAALEVREKMAKIGAGAGLGIGAALFALFGLGFLFAAGSAALALELPWWAALLITAGALFLLAAVLGLVGVSLIKKGSPPVPEQAIEEARLTQAALKSDGD